jgi:hypothetical protein
MIATGTDKTFGGLLFMRDVKNELLRTDEEEEVQNH